MFPRPLPRPAFGTFFGIAWNLFRLAVRRPASPPYLLLLPCHRPHQGNLAGSNGHKDDRVPIEELAKPGISLEFTRSEERRVGKEGVRTGRSRWSQYH